MPMGSSGAVSATAPFPWSRERSRVPAGRARGSSASGGSWILTQGRGRAMAKADLARTGSTIRCAIYTRKLASMGADAEPLAVSLMDLIGKRIQVICSTQNGREYLYEALDFAAKGKV